MEIPLQIRQLLLAAVEQVVLPGEAEREEEVLQLHQVEMARRIHGNPVEHLEELLAPPRLVVQRHQHGTLRPLALRAPWRRQHRFVQTGAQRVTRSEDDLAPHAGRTRLVLELANLFEHVPPEIRDVDRRGGPQLAGQEEQRGGRLDERIEAKADRGAHRIRNRLESRDPARGRARRRLRHAASATSGTRPHRPVRREKGIVACPA